MRRGLLALGGGLLLAAGLGACSGRDNDVTKTGPKVSDYRCAADAKSADAIEAAMRSSDEDDYEDAVRFTAAVPPGTNVRIMERVTGDHPKLHVVVLDGDFKDRQCWYPADVDGILEKKD